MEPAELLKRYFGHSAFREGQASLIDALLSGRDVLGVMPTGAGKSVCYQIPALMLPGVTLVLSPLISLMKDQVSALTQAGVAAAFLNSSLTAEQQAKVLRRARDGAYKILYVAPERLEAPGFLRFAEEADIALVAVDEAHCVSQWGQDFRPSYLKIPAFIDRLPKRPVIGAFTATATAEVKEDIIRLLALREPLCLTTGFDRPNLFFDVARPGNKLDFLLRALRERPEQSGVVYCATRANVERVCAALQAAGIPATRYHAGLSDEERRGNQDDFVFDRSRVMVATNAFGMGIDKSNVSFVYHYNMPKNLESYYQEAGRAGRDGSPADCVLLYSDGDVMTNKFIIQHGDENAELTEEERALVQKRDMERLETMIGYCKTADCLRAYLLRYFGEADPPPCGHCGSCTAERVLTDITLEAQKALSCVRRIENRFSASLGAALVTNTLCGSKEQRVLQLGLNELPTYGAMRDVGRARVREVLDALIAQGYLLSTGGEYPVLHTTETANAVLFSGETVQLSVRRQDAETAKQPAARRASSRRGAAAAPDEGLYDALRDLRLRLAQKANAPAYVIFSNAALADMAARKPRTREEFLSVSGVGEVKAKRYAEVFLSAIQDYLQNENEAGEPSPSRTRTAR